MTAHAGELLALSAAMIFAWTSVLFTTAGRRLGPVTLNLGRLLGATILLAATHRLRFGSFWPVGVPLVSLLWIGGSGILGLAIGDSALFQSFVMIGPRRAMMLMVTAPVFTTVVAWGALAEHLGVFALIGISVVIVGVLLAVAGRDPGGGAFASPARDVRRTGLLLALLAAACQGFGSAFVKIGMAGGAVDVDPLSATLVRLAFACAAAWLVVLPRRGIRRVVAPLRDRVGAAALAGATVLGPFVSVWVSIEAIRRAPAGVAQVLLSAVPVFVLLPAWLVYRDRPAPVSLVGVCVAIAGGALLFLR